jgi:hypothetical protein
LALNDFWLFPEIESALKGRRFQDVEDIQENVTTALKATPQQEYKKKKKIPTVAGSIVGLSA